MAQSEKQRRQPHLPAAIFGGILTYGRGQQLAKRELHDLECKLALAPREDWDALHDAMEMYRVGQLTLPGYALLLWHRLEAHDTDVYAYHEHISRAPVVWDGVQRWEIVQWNVLAADRWTAWANGAAHDTSDASDTESEAQS